MASTDATAIIERLLDDDYVHEQLATAGAGLRDVYRRARRVPPQKAVQDKTLYERVRQTAAALTEAGRRVIGKPKPKPPRRRRDFLLLVVLAAGAVVFWATKSRNETQEGAGASATATTQPAPTPAAAATATGAASSPAATTATDT
jgi:hypothetical protein